MALLCEDAIEICTKKKKGALNLMKGRERSMALGGVSGGAHLNALHYDFFTLRPQISPSFGILKHLGLHMNYNIHYLVNLQHRTKYSSVNAYRNKSTFIKVF